ncbi:hypothetical protein B0H19DRAFT_1251094 [Mycena capillaripes]|nr:hypothetical protein B0H19DRAFT_1251094 [Mycena capillaripes]
MPPALYLLCPLTRTRRPLRLPPRARTRTFLLLAGGVCLLLGLSSFLPPSSISAVPITGASSARYSATVYDTQEHSGMDSHGGLPPPEHDTLAAANALALSPGFSDDDARRAGLPPAWARFREAEARLGLGDAAGGASESSSGNNGNASEVRGKGYLWVANHVHGSGWGNALQELLLNAELAFRARRAFVFEDYTWARDGGPYAVYSGSENRTSNLIPARIPLAALIGGLPIGAPLPRQFARSHPRAVPRARFAQVCPNPEVLDGEAMKATLPPDASAPALFAALVAALDACGPCVQIDGNGPQVFDIWLFGAPARLLPAWPVLRASPILTRFRWAPLVRAALERNAGLFPGVLGPPLDGGEDKTLVQKAWARAGTEKLKDDEGKEGGEEEEEEDEYLPPVYDLEDDEYDRADDIHPPSSTDSPGSPAFAAPYEEQANAAAHDDVFPTRTYADTRRPQPPPLLPGLLALHVRRGDFAIHCGHLAEWGAEFNAFNGFGQLTQEWRDEGEVWGEEERSVRPEGGGWGGTTPGNRALYMRHCFPSIEQIVEKVRKVRTAFEARTGRWLGWVYVMTNADRQWLAELKAALRNAGVPVRVVEDFTAERDEGRHSAEIHSSYSRSGPRDATWIWDNIATSRDLVLTWEQRYIAQAVDMYIATRAEVFVGNG